MNNGTRIQRVKSLSLSQIPQQNHSIFPTRSTERNINSVDISRMSSKCVPQLTVGQIPNRNGLVPRRRDNCWLKHARVESNTANPIRMSITILDSVLALTKRVPELNRAITRSRHNRVGIVNWGGDDDGAVKKCIAFSVFRTLTESNR